MDFLEKLNQLMKQNNLNKRTLSKSCNIPYTTIDNWYKRGYEGLKLTTLKKLSDYFQISLDYWVDDMQDNDKAFNTQNHITDKRLLGIIDVYNELNEFGKDELAKQAEHLTYIPEYKKCDSIQEPQVG